MATPRRTLPEDLKQLLDLIQKGQLFTLQECIKAGKRLRATDAAEPDPHTLHVAILTGFHNRLQS